VLLAYEPSMKILTNLIFVVSFLVGNFSKTHHPGGPLRYCGSQPTNDDEFIPRNTPLLTQHTAAKRPAAPTHKLTSVLFLCVSFSFRQRQREPSPWGPLRCCGRRPLEPAVRGQRPRPARAPLNDHFCCALVELGGCAMGCHLHHPTPQVR